MIFSTQHISAVTADPFNLGNSGGGPTVNWVMFRLTNSKSYPESGSRSEPVSLLSLEYRLWRLLLYCTLCHSSLSLSSSVNACFQIQIYCTCRNSQVRYDYILPHIAVYLGYLSWLRLACCTNSRRLSATSYSFTWLLHKPFLLFCLPLPNKHNGKFHSFL